MKPSYIESWELSQLGYRNFELFEATAAARVKKKGAIFLRVPLALTVDGFSNVFEIEKYLGLTWNEILADGV